MMRATNWLGPVLLSLLVAAPARAQDHDPHSRREALRHRIEARFTQRVTEELNLTAEQTAKLQETSRRFGGRRRELEAREQAIRSALAAQLRPGIAADRDSVARLTEAAADVRVAYAETFRDELRVTADFLDPVQQAQLFIMRDRLLRRAREIRGDRWHQGGHRPRRRVAPPDSVRDAAP